MTEKATHTPGPWLARVTGSTMSEVYTQPFAIAQKGDANLVAGVFGDVRGGEDVAKANADLLAAAPDLLKLAGEAWGALNFILAFYEPGQRYLDTEAWKQAEDGGRRVHAALREKLDALPEAPK